MIILHYQNRIETIMSNDIEEVKTALKEGLDKLIGDPLAVEDVKQTALRVLRSYLGDTQFDSLEASVGEKISDHIEVVVGIGSDDKTLIIGFRELTSYGKELLDDLEAKMKESMKEDKL
jgi:hypothetical protein